MKLSQTALIALVAIAGCHSDGPRAYPPPQHPEAVEVRRVAASEAHSRWQAELVSRVEYDCLARPWLQRFIAERGRRPVIKVKPIQNRSSKLINVVRLTQQLEGAFLRSGKVLLTNAPSADADYEIADQQIHASDATVKARRQMVGADYLLVGYVESIYGSSEVYVTLDLLDLETGVKVWLTLSRAPLQD